MQHTPTSHPTDQSFTKLIYGLFFPPLLLEFTATQSSESIKQLAAGVSSFFSEQLLCFTAPGTGAKPSRTGLRASNIL